MDREAICTKIAELLVLETAYKKAAQHLGTTNTVFDFGTILHLTITDLKRQLVLGAAREVMADDEDELLRRDREDDAAERDEERGFYRGQGR